MDKISIKNILCEELESVNNRLIGRPRNNAAVVRFGLRILGDILDKEFELGIVDKTLMEGVFEEDSSHRKSNVDKILEAMCLMSEWKCGEKGAEYTYSDHLESGRDFEVVSSELRLSVASAFPKFSRWAYLYGFDGDMLSKNDFIKQLKRESYCLSDKGENLQIGGKQKKGYRLDIPKMLEKGLELSEEWKNPQTNQIVSLLEFEDDDKEEIERDDGKEEEYEEYNLQAAIAERRKVLVR